MIKKRYKQQSLAGRIDQLGGPELRTTAVVYPWISNIYGSAINLVLSLSTIKWIETDCLNMTNFVIIYVISYNVVCQWISNISSVGDKTLYLKNVKCSGEQKKTWLPLTL